MNLLHRGSAWLRKVQAEYASEEVLLLRGDSSCTCRAVVGRSSFEQTDQDGLTTSVAPRDFIIIADEYLVDDIQVEPRPGDRIVQRDPTSPLAGFEQGFVYEVMPDAGIPPWQWSDDFHSAYRVHTKYVSRWPIVDVPLDTEEDEDE